MGTQQTIIRMKKQVLISFLLAANAFALTAQEMSQAILLKSPGNPARRVELLDRGAQTLEAAEAIPLEVKQTIVKNAGTTIVNVSLTARERVYFNFDKTFRIPKYVHAESEFLMPGFWYHKNMRSPQEAPSFKTSDSWQVREDRLSTPLTGIFNAPSNTYYTVIRLDKINRDALTTHQSGEVILSGKTDLGFTGFKNEGGAPALVFGFPYHEAPKTYLRKLTLAPEVVTFEKLEKGETRQLSWEISEGQASSYGDFVSKVWTYSFDRQKPAALTPDYTPAQAKDILANFFKESYVDNQPLKYYSGVHMRTADCKSTGSAEVGFVGRVLLNAYNALEYGEAQEQTELVAHAKAIFDSYLQHGFTKNGFFREFVDFTHGNETQEYSIRRQSEGIFAVLNYLCYEKKKGRKHPEWEQRIKRLLTNFAALQQADGSFPRKFDDQLQVKDGSGGSTPSATVPLVMASVYFKQKEYLRQAQLSAAYLEREIISRSDYFSSTLDANCEDKEASLYASTAMYYLAQVSKGKERQHYVEQCKKAAYFCLTWYYTWDVPFATGQMLGDVGFKSRGWGNVSVENNHVDVFIFEFAAVLDWLAGEAKEQRLAAFSNVIKSSMLQLMPVKGRLFDIAKVGYYPEVVQHTNWDYGKNGKGFYNDIFAPGWTVASLWELLSPSRTADFLETAGK